MQESKQMFSQQQQELTTESQRRRNVFEKCHLTQWQIFESRSFVVMFTKNYPEEETHCFNIHHSWVQPASGRSTVALAGGKKRTEKQSSRIFNLLIMDSIWRASSELISSVRCGSCCSLFLLEEALQFRRKPINQRLWRALAFIWSEGHRNLYRELSPFSLEQRKNTFAKLYPLSCG